MGFFQSLKSEQLLHKAYKQQAAGNIEEALALYDQAFQGGYSNPRYALAYSVLLLRNGHYEKATEVLKHTEKLPGLNAEQKNQLYVNYAACQYKLGALDKAIRLLEKQGGRQSTGLIYETLGYLYVEKYDAQHIPDFDELDKKLLDSAKASWEKANKEAQDVAAITGNEFVPVAFVEPEKSLTAWNEGKEKAEAYIRESVDYDDEDSICLDNMGQFLYRVLDQKEAAREYFQKAIEIKPGQIDTLFFLAQYDLAEGNTDAAAEKYTKALEGRFSPLNYASKDMIEKELSTLKVH